MSSVFARPVLGNQRRATASKKADKQASAEILDATHIKPNGSLEVDIVGLLKTQKGQQEYLKLLNKLGSRIETRQISED